jgi:hypothetical protein
VPDLLSSRPHCLPLRVLPPPPLVAGEDTLACGRGGGAAGETVRTKGQTLWYSRYSTVHRVGRVLSLFSSHLNRDSPNPSPLWYWEEGHTRWRERWWISKVYLGSMCTAEHIGWAWDPATPPPPKKKKFGLIYEGAIGQSVKIDNSLWPPMV